MQSLQSGPGGVIYAATAPDGKVYKLEHKQGGNAAQARTGATAAKASDKDKDKDDKDKEKDKKK